MTIAETVTKFLKEQAIKEGAKFIIAVSGGADSVALLHVFKYLNLPILALHCNFSLRGKESNMDEQFVKRFCESYGIAHSTKKFDTRHYAKSKGISIEMAARELRYQWFEEMRQKKKMDYIVVAHHADDQAETIFINLCRGTGIRGLTGIRPVNGHILRPLLSHTKEEIMQYVEVNKLNYRTDSTNLTLDYVRNKIRHLVLPVCKEINPSFLKTTGATCDTMREIEQVFRYGIECLKHEVLHEEENEILIDIQKTLHAPAPYTLLYELLRPYGFNATQIEDILNTNQTIPGKQFQSGDYLLTKGRVYWRLFRVREENVFPAIMGPGEYQLPSCTVKVSEEEYTPDYTIPRTSNVACFDMKKINYPLTIRHWQVGDWFCPFGMKRSRKKLSDLFTDLKFSTKQKRESLLLLSGEEIIWVMGVRIDERHKLTSSTRKVLRVELSPRDPSSEL